MKKILLLAGIALLATACEKDPDMDKVDADLVVYTDHDGDADFGSYKTYFLPDSILEAGGYKSSYWKDENAQAIIAQVEANMEARGYIRETDASKKDEVDLGVQVSYVAQTNYVTTGSYYGGWWDWGFWGPWWGGWYYPFTMTYSYNTNTLVVEMLDLTGKGTEGEQKANIPVIWYANASGFQYSGRYNQSLLLKAVDQAFEQSAYVQSDN